MKNPILKISLLYSIVLIIFVAIIKIDNVSDDVNNSDNIITKNTSIMALENEIVALNEKLANYKIQYDISLQNNNVASNAPQNKSKTNSKNSNFETNAPEPGGADENMASSSILTNSLSAQEVSNLKMNNIKEKLNFEQIDYEWKNKSEQQFKDILNNSNLLGSSLVSSNCRTSICKLEVLHNTSESRYIFSDLFLEKLEWNSEFKITTSTDANGKLISNVYISREGNKLYESN